MPSSPLHDALEEVQQPRCCRCDKPLTANYEIDVGYCAWCEQRTHEVLVGPDARWMDQMMGLYD